MEKNLQTLAARQTELADCMYEFFGTRIKTEENTSIDLATWQNPVGAKAYDISVSCDEESMKPKIEAITEFLTGQKFVRVEENYREDLFVNEDGALARLNLIVMPGSDPSLRLLVQMPESIEEAELVKKYYNFPKNPVK